MYSNMLIPLYNIVGESCSATNGDLLMNSKCYRKFHKYSSSLTWYSASNDCLSRGGSLAVFANIGRPSDNSQLTNWLNTSGTDKSYWVGLLRSWWKTTDEGDFSYEFSVVPCSFSLLKFRLKDNMLLTWW